MTRSARGAQKPHKLRRREARNPHTLGHGAHANRTRSGAGGWRPLDERTTRSQAPARAVHGSYAHTARSLALSEPEPHEAFGQLNPPVSPGRRFPVTRRAAPCASGIAGGPDVSAPRHQRRTGCGRPAATRPTARKFSISSSPLSQLTATIPFPTTHIRLLPYPSTPSRPPSSFHPSTPTFQDQHHPRSADTCILRRHNRRHPFASRFRR